MTPPRGSRAAANRRSGLGEDEAPTEGGGKRPLSDRPGCKGTCLPVGCLVPVVSATPRVEYLELARDVSLDASAAVRLDPGTRQTAALGG
eukprot:4970129-Pyramimonas_sp.AAC.1